MRRITGGLFIVLALGPNAARAQTDALQVFSVKDGSHPHDAAPAQDGRVYFTAQHTGELGILDPATGESRYVPLGPGSAPHGVITGPDGNAWITDSGLNAIVKVAADTLEVTVYPLPAGSANANLNTAAFDASGVLWFTGQNGVYGRLEPAAGQLEVWESPGGRGPYGVTSTPDGTIYYASLAGSHIARIDPASGEATVLEPPTANQGARRVWSDSSGRIWVSEWNAGQLAVYDPEAESWREWPLPGDNPQAYAVYVDESDIIWVSDFGANAIHSFDPESESFSSYPLPSANASVRQILGRLGEVWLPFSGTDELAVIRTE